MRKLLILGCLSITSTYAAFNGLSHHSRANCAGFFESVSWDGTGPWHLHTYSFHQRGNKTIHFVEYGPAYVWRAASYHWNNQSDVVDKIDNVYGVHYHRVFLKDRWTQTITSAVDCNIYDGWWDTGSKPTPTPYKLDRGIL